MYGCISQFPCFSRVNAFFTLYYNIKGDMLINASLQRLVSTNFILDSAKMQDREISMESGTHALFYLILCVVCIVMILWGQNHAVKNSFTSISKLNHPRPPKKFYISLSTKCPLGVTAVSSGVASVELSHRPSSHGVLISLHCCAPSTNFFVTRPLAPC